MDEDYFWRLGCDIMKCSYGISKSVGMRRFKANFGVSPNVCHKLWQELVKPNNPEPNHLMWTLKFLKTYPTENVLATILERDEKTLRKYIWLYVTCLAELNVVHIFFFSI